MLVVGGVGCAGLAVLCLCSGGAVLVIGGVASSVPDEEVAEVELGEVTYTWVQGDNGVERPRFEVHTAPGANVRIAYAPSRSRRGSRIPSSWPSRGNLTANANARGVATVHTAFPPPINRDGPFPVRVTARKQGYRLASTEIEVVHRPRLFCPVRAGFGRRTQCRCVHARCEIESRSGSTALRATGEPGTRVTIFGETHAIDAAPIEIPIPLATVLGSRRLDAAIGPNATPTEVPVAFRLPDGTVLSGTLRITPTHLSQVVRGIVYPAVGGDGVSG